MCLNTQSLSEELLCRKYLLINWSGLRLHGLELFGQHIAALRLCSHNGQSYSGKLDTAFSMSWCHWPSPAVIVSGVWCNALNTVISVLDAPACVAVLGCFLVGSVNRSCWSTCGDSFLKCENSSGCLWVTLDGLQPASLSSVLMKPNAQSRHNFMLTWLTHVLIHLDSKHKPLYYVIQQLQ